MEGRPSFVRYVCGMNPRTEGCIIVQKMPFRLQTWQLRLRFRVIVRIKNVKVARFSLTVTVQVLVQYTIYAVNIN